MPMLLTAPAPTLTVADRVRWTAGGRPRPARAVTTRYRRSAPPTPPVRGLRHVRRWAVRAAA